MRIQRLLVPGRFQDAYLYRGWLIGLTAYRSLKFIHLPSISDQVLQFLKAPISGSSDVAVGQGDAGGPAPEGATSQLATEVLQITKEFTREVDLVVDANVVLDLAVYKEHLYLGTDQGLFTAPFQLSLIGRQLGKTLERRHDARTLKVTARFDTVTLSCGEEGLFGAVRTSEAHNDRIFLRKYEKQSLKNAWLQWSLVNYPSHQEWEILPAREEGWADGEERWRVADFPENRRFGLSSLLQEIRLKQPNFDRDDVQFSFNSDRYIFVHTFGGEFFSLRLSKRQGNSRVYFHRTYKGTSVRILSAAPLGSGVVIETKDRVFLFAQERWFHLIDRDVLSVRTFPSSQRFRNIVSIATEDGLHLVSVTAEKRRNWSRHNEIPE
jgi:hypothetical protein